MLRSIVCSLLFIVVATAISGCRNDESGGAVESENGAGGEASASLLTKADYNTAFELKNRGMAHLENKEWAEAEKGLADLAALLPQNRLAQRNLAVARVLALIDRESPFTRSGGDENIVAYRAAVSSAQAAIAGFRAFATDDFDKSLADLLMGKLLVHTDSPEQPSFEQGRSLLQKAADALPQVADFQFALAMAMDGSGEYSNADSPKSAALLKSLQKSFELAPENLFALQKLMQRQALCLKSKNEPTKKAALQITDTLKAAIKLLAPLNESIKKQRRMDLVQTITKALDGFDGSNTATLMGPAMMTGNLLLPEISAQMDQRRLNKNLLEYLLLEFDEEFLNAADKAGAIPKPELTVIKAFVPTEGLPQIGGVTQVELQDLNLDGFDELVVAREGRIEVYSRGTDLQADWKLLMTSPEANVEVTGFLLADIDRDFDKALSDIKNPSILRDADGDQKIPHDPAGKDRWYDTDLDVIAWGDSGVVIFRNGLEEGGGRTLSVIPQEEAIQNVNDIVAADLEADGDLDLVFATNAGMTLWKNIDGTVFQNMNDSASLPEHGMQSLAIVDWNQDAAMDVVGISVLTDGTSAGFGVLENMLHGRFRWLAEQSSTAAQGPFAIVQQSGSGRLWKRIDANALGLKLALSKIVTADFDNDGTTDALCLSADQTMCVRGLAGGASDSAGFPVVSIVMSNATAADIDDDGDLDIVYASAKDGSLGMLLNDGGNVNNWIDVVARAVPDDPQFPSNRVNMHGIGSVIEMRSGGLYHSEVITNSKIRLGLGKAKKADAIRIIWTDGIPQNVTVPDLLQPRIGILAPQILKGSCPYIYTWTGERFEYFSDCLWAAPIGLVQANGEIAPTREWENLLIPGEALVEKDGTYVLQLTEELWEVAYFDQVQLTSIDHPADVEIFTNEKVGPPSMAEHRIHTVRNARLPVAVTDGRGNDLLPGLTAVDGNYVQAFEGRVLQGLTDEWAMEFDLGELSSPQNVRLFLLGWIFPTDTSLNLGIEQNPSLSPPAPPSIEVPDGTGGWKVVRPFIGFPSGKTKAMVIDISDIFSGDDYRFRLKSSMELYWDKAFFTVDETEAETNAQPCELVGGDLRYRGFSHRTYGDNALFRNGRAPEGYDYQSVTTEPRWPPIAGRFTRYGNTASLLADHDDRMVVMGPGDALTVEFAIPQTPVPRGWKRDFVLRNVGYDKDADLNTIYGQSSEPFPFRAMTRYPFAPDDLVPDSPDYRQYIEEWQTREYSRQPFWNAMRRN